MPEDIDIFWDRVATRCHPARRDLVPGLREFLASLNNPHAALLSGTSHEGAPDGASAVALEAMVIAQLREHKLSKLEVADWLRLLYDVQKQIKSSGMELTLTRLADVLPPQPSPFAPQPMAISQRVEHWRRALHHWIEHSSPETARAQWQAAISLSAILHGALLDSAKIKALLERMHQHEPLSIASRFGYMDFNLPFQGRGNHHLHRWFPDPLTDMLLARLPHDGEDLSVSRLASACKKLLCAHGIKKTDSPTGLADLVGSAATWWSQHAAQIDIQGASRKFTTHSIHPRSWARLHRLKVSDRRLKKARSGDTAAQSNPPEDEAGMIEDVLLLHPWLSESIDLFDSTAHAMREGVSCLIEKSTNTPLAAVYLGWLGFMMSGYSASGDGMTLSTIRRLFCATAPRLILELGDTNPAELDTPELEDHYAEMTVEVDPGAPIRDIATGLREFHAYLVRVHGKPHIGNITMVLGDDARLLPVDANLVSFDDYLAAQKWLDTKLAEGRDPDDTLVCKLVMAMAFRLGMRRMEILGLRLQDIRMEGGMVCLIRHHAGRRLKTGNAKRWIPMQAFLDWRERKLLRQWVVRRSAEEDRKCLPPGSIHSHYLFAIVDAKHAQERVSVEGVVDRITEALRAVTDDRRLYLHHLRHSFGSWTYLRLRAPDYPMIESMFGHLPATASAIKASTRLRRLLLGSIRSPSRVFAYAVARLLGHSSPAISMGHYIHVGDVILAAIVQREIAQVPRPVLVAASGLPQSTAYTQLKNESVHSLAVSVRNLHSPAAMVDVDVDVDVTASSIRKLPGRPVKAAPHLSADWVALNRVRSVLHLFANANQPMDTIAAQLGLSVQVVETILCQAWRLGPLIQAITDSDALFTLPYKPKYPAETALAKELEEKLAEMAIRAPKLYAEGLDLHLAQFNRQKHDIVFKGTKEKALLRRYLKFLSSLDMDHHRFQWVVRKPANENADLPAWAMQLDASWLPARIKRIGPPALSKAVSYGQWLGIMITDNKGDGLGKAMATTMYLARISHFATSAME